MGAEQQGTKWSSSRLKVGSSGFKLAVVLEQRDMGALSLAKLLYPAHQVEDGRKTVRRWLNGKPMAPASQRSAEVALGLERGALESDEDDLEQELMNAIRQTADRYMRERLAGRAA